MTFESFPDLGSLSDPALKELIGRLDEEEADISYQRRLLHGKIDILKAELVSRVNRHHAAGEVLVSGEDVQRLADILAGRAITS
ncbi:MAG TPA: hypothetical protein VHX88_02625 [Solirubrobacteraceae bacterium]|jgi:hypothetical protein|nr:hypothetical protein [Solirubrobacteraceae bacterium]